MKVRSVLAIVFIIACAFVAVWRWAPRTGRLAGISGGGKPRIVSLSPAITRRADSAGSGGGWIVPSQVPASEGVDGGVGGEPHAHRTVKIGEV